ncbi:apolipoprotein N-acyltransferase [Kitasatospora sp. NPDC001175]|uniref:apolipoprotein N-acyltransferase n=1 Tax=Kitasatospora sp. NPDC001175 TaxID=3157103 RepID=UPI003D00F7D7
MTPRLARLAALLAGALPVLAFPAPSLAPLAWVALVPGLLLMRYSPSGREAAVRGWWFGTGFLLAALYWLFPSIGPALLPLAVVFGALQTALGLAVWRLLHPPLTLARALGALVVVPSVWVSTEYARSWQALGGPWALLGASQWQHPAVLALASVGGAWLVSAAVVAANTGVVIALTDRQTSLRVLSAAVAALAVVSGPVLFALRTQPSPGDQATVALVQPGVTRSPGSRFDASATITTRLLGQPIDLVVWGESSTAADLDRDTAALDRLRGLATTTGAQLLVGEDARKGDGRISKDAVLVTPGGITARYRKIRLVPFGEYIPLRPLLGWVAGISKAAGENRVPGTGFHLIQASTRDGHPLPLGTMICFESAFPDMSRTAANDGAGLLVYQSATSTFQNTWAPAQHASLGALRAAETGRPVVQAALTGESVAYDRQGRRLAHLDTSARGALTVRVPLADPAARTWYDRLGDWTPLSAVTITLTAGGLALLRPRPAAPTALRTAEGAKPSRAL